MIPPPHSFNISTTTLLFLPTLCILTLLIPITTSAPTLRYSFCSNTTKFSQNSPYQSNLNTLLSALSSNATLTLTTGFYSSTSGTVAATDTSYGLFLCRGDLSPADCRDCVSTAATEIVQKCNESKRAVIWYDECMLRYSYRPILATLDLTVAGMLHNVENITEPKRFNELLGRVMDKLATRAANSESGSGEKFATGEAMFSLNQTLYGLAQCTPDLSGSDCERCLRDGISLFPTCCDGMRGGRVMFPSCVIRYEMYPFYAVNVTAPSPSPLPPSPSPLPPPPPATSPGKGGTPSRVLVAIIVPIGAFVLLFVVGFFLCRKAQKKYCTVKEDTGGDEISTLQSLQYDLGTIQAATNNFSDDNKIGEGGFGPVYKGTLPNGEKVAVKRLSKNSGQGAEQFKSELALAAKLQHRNLVRLLGFCLEGEEKILIYEFVPNKSLDKFLFDPQEQEKLDWTKRYKIIGGIARGMLYLHEDSQLRIVHRDLKASNILLDGDINAKISDFGLARIFGEDQTHQSTSRVAGTYGYIAPEYIVHEQFSTKCDVFSFGVLVLEIITGKKNTSFYQSDSTAEKDLLSYSWKHWWDGTQLDLMDPTLEGSCSRDEVAICIHIALLCVQDDPCARPSMATVVLMLDSQSTTMSLPQQPALCDWSRTGSNTVNGQESDQSTSKPITGSVNEASITELEPR